MIKELRTLVAVAEHGSITAAAQHIGLTQAAASAQIQRLEESLQAQLFDRVGRQVRLNAAGVDAVARAEHILHLCDELRDAPQRGSLRGHLRLGAIQSMQRQYLPRIIEALIGEHPEVSTHLELGGSLPLLTLVDHGKLDAALVVKPFFALPPELKWVPLLQEPFKVVCPAGEAGGDWRQILKTLPFIRYDSASFGGRVVDRFLQAHRLVPRCQIQSQDVDAILEMVACGLGAALVPITDGARHQGRIRALDLGEHCFYREVGMVHPVHPRQGGLAMELVRVTQAQLRGAPFAHPLLALE
ncbi:LysR family transcriptional regulator [Bordetella bronchiseptica]|uniref:LysR family transcriptional regulator n=1 Tax=Bordetella bronchiseptica TaxID=518 RepID=UPI00028AC3D1|nr:LysR family transcriptional regulator [Bordetella bronchiseptica]KDD59474.1 LysR substrate-binding domain protein [Bordetella bronchiseptica OSU553]AUL17885.1 LysR family transcriptional regulator [Bordetella bronchiseptica]AWP61120.1 LysR family transcriptional regulator [Bordetella bronchiseptica]AWQ07972.1 LysR family transcriptional regulator [Bordetella bronchiseptica]AZW30148.1 LysR family transcriptional regulator [Bordetella bronchiseptica]